MIDFPVLNSKLIDQTMQVTACHSERARAFRLAPIALPQCTKYQAALEAPYFFFIGLADGQALGTYMQSRLHAVGSDG